MILTHYWLHTNTINPKHVQKRLNHLISSNVVLVVERGMLVIESGMGFEACGMWVWGVV